MFLFVFFLSLVVLFVQKLHVNKNVLLQTVLVYLLYSACGQKHDAVITYTVYKVWCAILWIGLQNHVLGMVEQFPRLVQ